MLLKFFGQVAGSDRRLRSLFRTSDKGLLVEDLNPGRGHLFQDSAGTIPVTAAGQPVGCVLDLSGRGNHLTHSISAKRPTLGRHPRGGVRNLLSSSEDLTKSGWAVVSSVLTGAGPDFTIVPNAGTPGARIQGTYLTAGAVRYKIGLEIRPLGAAWAHVGRGGAGLWVNVVTGETGTNNFGTGGSLVSATVGPADADGWRSVVVVFDEIAFATPTITQLRIYPSVGAPSGPDPGYAVGNDGVAGVAVRRPYLQLGTAGGYQRVTSQYDVTEVGVPAIWYLDFDGVDDQLVTPVINWGSHEVTLLAGVNRRSNSNNGVVAEFSTDTDVNAGFYLLAPAQAGNTNFGVAARVSITVPLVGANPLADNEPAIIGLTANSAQPRLAARKNGAEVVASAANQGAGNYGNYPIYIGERGGAQSVPFNGRLYGLLAINRVLSQSELTVAERWLAVRTGVVL